MRVDMLYRHARQTCRSLPPRLCLRWIVCTREIQSSAQSTVRWNTWPLPQLPQLSLSGSGSEAATAASQECELWDSPGPRMRTVGDSLGSLELTPDGTNNLLFPTIPFSPYFSTHVYAHFHATGQWNTHTCVEYQNADRGHQALSQHSRASQARDRAGK